MHREPGGVKGGRGASRTVRRTQSLIPASQPSLACSEQQVPGEEGEEVRVTKMGVG